MKLSPINRKPVSFWRHKLYGSSIKITRKPKYYKTVESLSNAITQAEECMRHKIDYALMKNSYRLYRRGKNRCNNCGIKLEAQCSPQE